MRTVHKEINLMETFLRHQNIKLRNQKISIVWAHSISRLWPNADGDDLDRIASHAREPNLGEQPPDIQLMQFRMADETVTGIDREAPVSPFGVWS